LQDDATPTVAWKQLSEAFGIGLLCLAYLTYSQAQTGDATSMAAYGKILAYAWIAWTLVRFNPNTIHTTPPQPPHAPFNLSTPLFFWQMHVKWLMEGSLISSGPLKGQVGGWIPCAILAAIGVTTFLM
jgi:hypothetical protein